MTLRTRAVADEERALLVAAGLRGESIDPGYAFDTLRLYEHGWDRVWTASSTEELAQVSAWITARDLVRLRAEAEQF